MKLHNDQELILRLLHAHSSEKDHEAINARIHKPENYDILLEMGLLGEEQEGDTITFFLTEKGKKLIEEGGYVIKYPLASEAGTVNNYITVLNSLEKSAARALGKSIIKTEVHKRWGKQNNLELLQVLQNTADFYRTFDHPVARLDALSNDISKAESKLDRALVEEMAKIENFSLPKPINLGLNSLNEKVKLVGIEGNGIAIYDVSDADGAQLKPAVKGNYLTDAKFFIPSYIKKLVIREYYMSKSKQPKKTKES